MDPLAVAERYFDAWNAHDSEAIASTFAPGGTYSDPRVSALDGLATGAHAASLWESFPDLAFEVSSIALTHDGRVNAEWVMRGTNSGSFQGLPPTEREVALAGADFITFAPEGIATVQGYYDSAEVPRQLGLDVIVQPSVIGPFAFGTSVRVNTGGMAVPGALALTMLEVRSDREKEDVRARTRAIAGDLAGTPGLISMLFTAVGHRMNTLSAWESPEAARALSRNAHHQEAVRWAFGPSGPGVGASFALFVRQDIHSLVRCETCNTMNLDPEVCRQCGAELPTASGLV